MSRPIIFISHVTEEAELAGIFKQHVTADFLGRVEVFVSSDTESVSAGENWLTSVLTHLRKACCLLVLCSKASIKRPWIHFEAGAAWIRDTQVVPICHAGLMLRDLPMPFTVLQAVEANKKEGLDRIYRVIADRLKCTVPSPDFGNMIEEIQSLEETYTGKLEEMVKVKDEDETNRKEALSVRMRKYLETRKRPGWRTIERIVIRCGARDQDEVRELLKKDPDVEFKPGWGPKRAGKEIARIVSKAGAEPIAAAKFAARSRSGRRIARFP
jgi:hypothetical protein